MRRAVLAAQVAAAGWKVPLAAALTGVLLVPWAAVAVSGPDETPYGFAGEYTDAHGVSDLGQRWYDPRHQLLYGPDPAAADEPAALLGDPRLTGSYTLNHHNSYARTDPDGRKPRPTRTIPHVDPAGRLVWLTLLGSSAPAPELPADTEAVGVPGEDGPTPTAVTSVVLPPPEPAAHREFDLAATAERKRPPPWWWLEGDDEWDNLLGESQTADFREEWDDLEEFLVMAHSAMGTIAEWSVVTGTPREDAVEAYEDFFQPPLTPQAKGMLEHRRRDGTFPGFTPPPPPPPLD